MHAPHNPIKRTHAKILVSTLNTQCHELILMIKLLIVNVIQLTPQNRVSDIVMYVTINTINGVVQVHIVFRREE